MKKKLLLVPLIASGLIITSCGDTTTSQPTSEVVIPSYKIRNITIDVNESFNYDISFKTDKEIKESVKYYVSSNSKFDAKDKEFTPTIKDGRTSFEYKQDFHDFYILTVGKDDNEIYAKQNISLPTFLATIENGTNSFEGKDMIKFEYLENGYTPDIFFDDEGISIYQTNENKIDKTTATKVKENVTISDYFTVNSLGEEVDTYYFFEISNGGGVVTYTSQLFKKGTLFGSDLLTPTKASLYSTNGAYLKLEGTVKEGLSLTPKFNLMSANDTSNDGVLLNKEGTNFTTEFDLSLLGSSNTQYKGYIMYSAGIFQNIDSNIIEDVENRIFDANSVYGFDSTSNSLSVFYSEKGIINIFTAKFVYEEGKPYFVSKGIYDNSLFSEENGPISNPILLINNDQNNTNDINTFPLTINEEAKTFEVKADLTTLDKMGAWYNVKIFFNSETQTNEETGLEEFKYAQTYEYLKGDVTNYNQKLLDEKTQLKYEYQEYSGFLKIAFVDASLSVTAWNYVLIDGKMNLELIGTYFKGNGSYIDVHQNVDGTEVSLIGQVIPEEDGSFITHIDVSSIKEGLNYHVHWRFQGGSNDEITNKFFEHKPNAVASDTNGFIYCVKQEEWAENKYYKVHKDLDAAKANVVSFGKSTSEPTFTIEGALNSTLKEKDLYIKFADDHATTTLYAKLTVNDDFRFSATVQLKSFTNTEVKLEARLVEKVGEEYIDVPSGANEYCGFYNEYLLYGYNETNLLVTDTVTYRVNTYNGEESRWTLYIYCE